MSCPALAALEEIAKREGAYSRDPLKHAENTIDNMENIARAAIREHEAHEDCLDDTCPGGTECPCVVADRETRRARA